MLLQLGKLGEHESKVPSSIATCLDFVSIWGSEPNRAQLGRLCAAAIAVSVDHKRILPAYPLGSGDPIAFGYKILDRLLDAGVSPAKIYEMGSAVLLEMMRLIPSESEVEERANFSQVERRARSPRYPDLSQMGKRSGLVLYSPGRSPSISSR